MRLGQSCHVSESHFVLQPWGPLPRSVLPGVGPVGGLPQASGQWRLKGQLWISMAPSHIIHLVLDFLFAGVFL